jgi:DMSO/TMAO reductase YedYZ molybdopterin-dependent catalytic subunit
MIGKFFRKRPDDPRVPPGQSVTEGFPVLTYGPTPRLDPAEVEVRVSGLADPVTFSLEDLRAMPRTDIRRDFHCVTHWSKMEVGWTGVRTTDLMHAITLRDDPTHVMLHCYGGYTTNLTLDDFLAEDCLLAYALEGGAIAADHGGPLRVIVPHLYAWKSAKWLAGLEFMRGDRPGFWERNGYHRRGDPFAEQRYG